MGSETKRTITQIAVTGVQNTASTQCDYVVVALCDDGTAWELVGTQAWQQLPPIPQAVPDAD